MPSCRRPAAPTAFCSSSRPSWCRGWRATTARRSSVRLRAIPSAGCSRCTRWPRRPDLFNAIVAVSPSLPWRQGESVKRIDAMLAQQRTLKCSLYVTLGDEGQAMKAGLDRLRVGARGEGRQGPALGPGRDARRRSRVHRSSQPLHTRSRRSSRDGACRALAPGRSRAASKRSRPTTPGCRTGSAGRSRRQRPRSTPWDMRRWQNARSTRRWSISQTNVRNYPEQPQHLRQPGRGSRGRRPARRGAGEVRGGGQARRSGQGPAARHVPRASGRRKKIAQ